MNKENDNGSVTIGGMELEPLSRRTRSKSSLQLHKTNKEVAIHLYKTSTPSIRNGAIDSQVKSNPQNKDIVGNVSSPLCTIYVLFVSSNLYANLNFIWTGY